MANTRNYNPHRLSCIYLYHSKHTLPTFDFCTHVINPFITLYQEKKKVTNKASEMKRTRRDRREMEEVMFNLFEGQSNWTLRLLIQETDQPEVKLKGKFTFLYSLNERFQKKKI